MENLFRFMVLAVYNATAVVFHTARTGTGDSTSNGTGTIGTGPCSSLRPVWTFLHFPFGPSAGPEPMSDKCKYTIALSTLFICPVLSASWLSEQETIRLFIFVYMQLDGHFVWRQLRIYCPFLCMSNLWFITVKGKITLFDFLCWKEMCGR